MNAAVIILATAVVGVDTGWTTLADGGLEYVIQIEPQLLESLRNGEDIASDIPAPFRGARRYRITVGKGPLPGQDRLPPRPKIEEPVKEPARDDPKLDDRPKKEAFSFGEPTVERPSWANPPAPFTAPKEAQPVAERVGFVEPSVGEVKKPVAKSAPTVELPKLEPPRDQPAKSDPPSKPWLPLMLVTLVLFASLGGNAYLGWMFAGTRGRYRSLLNRTEKGVEG